MTTPEQKLLRARQAVNRFKSMAVPPQPSDRAEYGSAIAQQQPRGFSFLQHDESPQMRKFTGS
ncbi:MAG: hypothetical protein E7C36_00340 [Mixta calida]|uniref:Uncharacterized protein n=1 Tax=Mixta calida TaxID=665913 RepID=A0ABN5H5F5_9GAMM|nr:MULTISPECIES: hypothetical protein [Mixta]AIX75491.1 hypothetical protein PSNIH2_18175 [Pantoea sp. PSNIH2]MBS6058566.1 hypothetical protein [Pantoea sp.]POU49859.1 hypothetical protein C3380_06880 [Pantoea sp. PSNIH5]POU69310.1 hypothetical protein C3374_07125 [Pantoea sp. PSNIH4]POY65779.1 hypothetical protein C3402_21660 [Pantoea sp. PSNIH3]